MRGWFDVRPPGGGLAFYVGFMVVIAAVLMLYGITGKLDDPFMEWVATGMFVVGVGLWLKHSWARWVAFTFFSLVALLSLVHFATHGISARGVIRMVILLSTLYALWEWDVWPAEEPIGEEEYDEHDWADSDAEATYDEEEVEEEVEAIDSDPIVRESFWSTRQ